MKNTVLVGIIQTIRQIDFASQQIDMSEIFDEEHDQEKEVILSFDSLREAFENVDSDDQDFFTWEDDESSESQHNVPTPYSWVQSSNLSVYPSTENEEESNEEPTDFEPDAVDVLSAEISDEESIKLDPISLFEAMLFVGDKENQPLPPERAAKLMRNVSPEEIVQIAETLNTRYSFLNCPYEVIREKNGFRLRLKSDFESIRTKFYGRIKEATLTQTAIDVLSIVAYKQPITAESVEKILKQSPGSVLSQLVRRDLLCVMRKNERKIRTAYYQTTDRFLQLFGLESLDQLPIVDDLDGIS